MTLHKLSKTKMKGGAKPDNKKNNLIQKHWSQAAAAGGKSNNSQNLQSKSSQKSLTKTKLQITLTFKHENLIYSHIKSLQWLV